jgi:hypothetical protein
VSAGAPPNSTGGFDGGANNIITNPMDPSVENSTDFAYGHPATRFLAIGFFDTSCTYFYDRSCLASAVDDAHMIVSRNKRDWFIALLIRLLAVEREHLEIVLGVQWRYVGCVMS